MSKLPQVWDAAGLDQTWLIMTLYNILIKILAVYQKYPDYYQTILGISEMINFNGNNTTPSSDWSPLCVSGLCPADASASKAHVPPLQSAELWGMQLGVLMAITMVEPWDLKPQKLDFWHDYMIYNYITFKTMDIHGYIRTEQTAPCTSKSGRSKDLWFKLGKWWFKFSNVEQFNVILLGKLHILRYQVLNCTIPSYSCIYQPLFSLFVGFSRFVGKAA